MVKVIVSERIYKKYTAGEVVRIYYSDTDPLEFIIKGE